PTSRIICASYSDELARKFSRDVRIIMESSWYKRVFPKTRLDKVTETEITTTMGGFRLATSVDGVATGRGGNLLIIDDAIKAGNASSAAERQKVKDWFDQTMSTRLDDKKRGAILVIMQRVHEDDLIGHLLGKGGWELLKLPAIATERETIAVGKNKFHTRQPGDVLHPEREDLSVLNRIKANMGGFAFAAQYQQCPVPAEGNVILREWIRFYDGNLEFGDNVEVVQSWDVAQKTGSTNDYSVCSTWVITQGFYFLHHVDRVRLQLPALIKRVHTLARNFRATAVLIEDVGPGTSLFQGLGRVSEFSILPTRPKGDKQSRVEQASVIFESGKVFVNQQAPWAAEYLSEILGFPRGRFDDQVDSTTQFLLWQRDRERCRQYEVNAYLFNDGFTPKLPNNYFARNGVRPPF
ncbi:MAG: phage terminase large subunit, partial [Alphaproteobacteria bacterium]